MQARSKILIVTALMIAVFGCKPKQGSTADEVRKVDQQSVLAAETGDFCICMSTCEYRDVVNVSRIYNECVSKSNKSVQADVVAQCPSLKTILVEMKAAQVNNLKVTPETVDILLGALEKKRAAEDSPPLAAQYGLLIAFLHDYKGDAAESERILQQVVDLDVASSSLAVLYGSLIGQGIE